MTDSRYTKNNASVGQVWSEAYADNLDNQLDTLSKRFWYVDDQTWVTQNAVYNGTGWDRIDTAKPALALQIDPSNNYMRVLQADAGANPIVWTVSVTLTGAGRITATELDSRHRYAYAIAASDEVRYSDASSSSTWLTTATTLKSKRIPGEPTYTSDKPMSVRVVFSLAASPYGSHSPVAYAQIYVQDAWGDAKAVGTLRSNSSSTPASYSEDVSVLPGDTVQIRGYRNDCASCGIYDLAVVSAFSVRGTDAEISDSW